MHIAVLVLIPATSIWVWIDAFVLGIKAPPLRPGGRKGFLDYGPLVFFIACLLLWVIGFPAYLVRRQRHVASSTSVSLRAKPARDLRVRIGHF